MPPIPIEHRPLAPNAAPDAREVFERIERLRRRLRRLSSRATAGASPALECGGVPPLFFDDQRPNESSPAPNG